jgi:hypothetical protein
MTQIHTKAFPALAVIIAALILTGCAGGGSWYNDYCQRKGYQPGTSAFEQCRVETKKWIDWTQGRLDSMRPGGGL